MASLEGDIEGGEIVLGLGLVLVIGYFLYKLSTSACNAINSLFGLSTASCSGDNTPQPGGSYASAANQVITDPLGSIESILGVGPGYDQPSIIGSAVVNPPSAQTGTTPAQQVSQAYVTGSSL